VARTDVTEKVAGLFDGALEPIISTFRTALNRKVSVQFGEIHPVDGAILSAKFPGEILVAQAKFSEGLSGGFDFVLTSEVAARLADLMLMGEGDAEFDAQEHPDAVSELLNQIGGVLSTYLGDLKGSAVALDPVSASVTTADQFTSRWESCFQVDLRLKIEGFEDAEMTLQILPETVADLELLGDAEKSAGADRPPPAVMDDETLEEVEQGQTTPEVHPAAFEDFGPESGGGKKQSIEALMDLELPVIIELGRTTMFIRDILELSPGSIVELNKLSGEPVDLYINDKRFARGEVVVIDENFGIRIVDLVKVEDRIRSLQ
jgi:flagellar motor switch protein FliN/FliY